jgi:hypothetical protein
MCRRWGASCISNAGSIGNLGIVPGLEAPGDHSTLVQVFRMPLMLRDKGRASVTVDGKKKKVRTWGMLRRCYVHDVIECQLREKREDGCRDLWIT